MNAMILFGSGFACGILFSILWVFLWVAIDVAHAAGRKWSWRHGFSKHAAELELSKFNEAIQAASEMTQEQRDALFGPKNLNRHQDANRRRD